MPPLFLNVADQDATIPKTKDLVENEKLVEVWDLLNKATIQPFTPWHSVSNEN
jgi:hypothetical protein